MIRNAKKVAREIQGPSLFEVTLGAVLSVLLGAVLAAGYLIVQPVETVRVMPKEPDPHKTYYVQGNARSSLGRQWMRKKQLLVESGAAEINLNEDELNAWLGSIWTKPDADAASGILTVREINFHLADSRLQIGVPCTLALAGISREFVVQTKGRFGRSDDRFVYEPDAVMVGTLALERIPVIGSVLVNRLLGAQEFPDDLKAAWKSLSAVSVEGDTLKLVRR